MRAGGKIGDNFLLVKISGYTVTSCVVFHSNPRKLAL